MDLVVLIGSLLFSNVILPNLLEEDGIIIHKSAPCNMSEIKARSIVESVYWYNNVNIDKLNISLCDNSSSDIFITNNINWERQIIIQAFNQACKHLKQLDCYNEIDIRTILDIFVRSDKLK